LDVDEVDAVVLVARLRPGDAKQSVGVVQERGLPAFVDRCVESAKELRERLERVCPRADAGVDLVADAAHDLGGLVRSAPERCWPAGPAAREIGPTP
jgi:hypothetical protein